jgi:hypothetical protein
MRNANIAAVALTVGFFALAAAMDIHPQAGVDQAERSFSGFEREDVTPSAGSMLPTCEPYVFDANFSAGLRLPEKWRDPLEWEHVNKCIKHKVAKFELTKDGFMENNAYHDYLVNQLGLPHAHWDSTEQLPGSPSDVESRLGARLRPNDDVYLKWKGTDTGHVVIIVDTSPATSRFNGENSPAYHKDLYEWLRQHKDEIAWIDVVHFPDKIHDCRAPSYVYRNDSTFRVHFGYAPGSDDGYTTHQQICCWHENLANTWPWYWNSSAYACLSWPESSGTVWDSMISPRMNFVGDSAVQFRQRTYSTLQHLSGTTIAVKGSTDNGTTWPYVLGDDELTEADLPWASNQRNVRIVWTFKGPPQTSAFWCVDDVEIWAKPTRNRDVSVSGVARPYGIIGQGQTVVPGAMVWNHGKQPETLNVTMHIGSSYSDTRSVMLYPYNDTLLEFEPWTAIHGDYIVTAFCAIDSDECRANDTAALNFRVTGDSWVDLGPIYGSTGTNGGACVTTTPDGALYAAIGNGKEFAKYSQERNLWDVMARTPRQFEPGAGLAYPDTGDYLYGRSGNNKRLYRYSMTNNSWDSLADAPYNLIGGLASGGNGFLYALRGGTKQTFCRYSIANNAWDTLARFPVKPGGVCFIAPGGGDYLFAFRGQHYCNFYRYSISANTWTQVAAAPVEVYLGAAMAYCPRGNKLYATFGNDYNLFYEYDIANGTWVSRPSLPHEANAGAFLAYLDHSIYASCGNGSDNDLHRYSLPGAYDASSTGPLVPSGSIQGDTLAVVIPAGTVANNFYSTVNVPARMTITQVQTDGLGAREPKAKVPELNPGAHVGVAGKAASTDVRSDEGTTLNSTLQQTGVSVGQLSSGIGEKKVASVRDRFEAGPAGSGKTVRVIPKPTANDKKGQFSGKDDFTYSHDVSVLLSPYSSARVEFPACTLATGKYRVVLRTMLSSDENPGNDSTVDSVWVKKLSDVGATRVVEPALGQYTDKDTIHFAVMVQNFADTLRVFPVKLWRNDTLRGTKSETLAAQDSGVVVFADTILAENCYHVKFATCLAGDERPANDTVRKDVIVGPARDAQAKYPIAPSGVIASDTPYVVIPTGWVRNNYDSTLSIPVRLRVGDSCVRETLAVVPARESAAVTFAPCTLALGSHRISLVTHMSGDRVPGNDSIADSVRVRRLIDVAASRVLAPLDSVYTIEDTLTYGVLVKNGSDRTQTFPVRLLQNDTLLDEQEVMIPGLDSLEVWFDDLPLRHGNYCFKFVMCLDSDERRGNDTLAKTIRVKSGDYWVFVDSSPEALARLCWSDDGGVYAAARNELRVDRYDPEGDTWGRLANPPVSAVCGITAVDSTVYVLGMGMCPGLGQGNGPQGNEGLTPESQGDESQGGTTQILTLGPGIWRYAPENDSWLFVKACGPTVLLGTSSNLVGTHDRTIYVVGCGLQTFRYFLARDSWTTVQGAPVINNWGAAGWMDGRLYVIASSSALWRYSEGNGQWSNLPGLGKGLDYGSALACDRAAERAFAFWHQGTVGKGFSELRDTGRVATQLTWFDRRSLASETQGAAMCFGTTQGYCLDGAGGFWRYRPQAVFDVAAIDLVMPETIHADTPFVPVAVFQNDWEDSLSCQLTVHVGSYSYSPWVAAPPQSRMEHQFGSMWFSPGTYQTSFQVSVSGGDSIPANDQRSGTLFVPLRHDAAAVQIFGVTGGVRYDSLLHPGGVVSNLWSDSLTIRVMLAVDSVYLESTTVWVPAQHSETVWFDTCRLSIGTHYPKLGVGIVHDEQAQNDTLWTTVNVVGNGWLTLHSAPPQNPVLCDGTDSLLYAADRYGAGFNEYNMLRDTWRSRASSSTMGMVSLSRVDNKVFGLGIGGANGCIKRYRTNTDQWSTVKNTLPVALSDACGLVARDTLKMYLVGPGWTGNFWRYDVVGDSWHTLTSMPTMQPFNWVSCAWDRSDSIYVLTGPSKHVYRYSTSAGTWASLTTLPQSMNASAALSLDAQRKLLPAMGGGMLSAAQSTEFSLSAQTWSNPVGFPGLASHPSLTVSNGRLFGAGGGSATLAAFAEYVRVVIDATALDIVSLPDTFRSDSVPHPGGVVRNLSYVPITCQVTLSCGASQKWEQVQLAPMQYDTVWLGLNFDYPPGEQTVSLTVSCTGDVNPGNDVYSKQVFVRAPWVPRRARFAHGRLDSDSSTVFAADAQTDSVMRYYPALDSWQPLRRSPLQSGHLDIGYLNNHLYVIGAVTTDRAKGPARVAKGKSGQDVVSYRIYRLALGDTAWQTVCESLPDSTSPGCLIPTTKGLYVLPASGTKLVRFDSAGGWAQKAPVPCAVVSSGIADWDRNDTIFFSFTSSAGVRKYLHYSLTKDTWFVLGAPPESGMALAVEPGGARVLMTTLDSLGSALFEHATVPNGWNRSTNTPPETYAGMALCFAGSDAWLMTGGPTQMSTFWRYDPDFGGSADRKGGLGGTAGWSGQLQHPCLTCEPNPFNQSCRITYALPRPGNVCLKLYDVTGRHVMTLANGYTAVGNHVTNVSSKGLANGIYLLKLESADYKATRKLILE